METNSLKKTFYKDEDVHFEVEECGEWLILHCDVMHWSKSRYKKMLGVFGFFWNYARENGHTKLVSFSPNPKFCRLFGGQFESAFFYKGQVIEVMKWDLK